MAACLRLEANRYPLLALDQRGRDGEADVVEARRVRAFEMMLGEELIVQQDLEVRGRVAPIIAVERQDQSHRLGGLHGNVV